MTGPGCRACSVSVLTCAVAGMENGEEVSGSEGRWSDDILKQKPVKLRCKRPNSVAGKNTLYQRQLRIKINGL